MKRSALFFIHSWSGLLSGLFILLMSLSGAVLVFHEEIDSLQYPFIHLQNNAPILSVDSAYNCLHKAFPHARISSCSIAENINSPYIFSLYDSSYANGKESMQVFLHPQTAAVLGTRGGSNDWQNNFMSWLTVFHNSFHLKQKGEWLLGILSVIFFISLLTGTILYRRKIKSVLLFRKGIFNKSNFHQVIGVYTLLFNLLIAGTGLWMQRYVFKKEFYATAIPYKPVIKPSPALFFNIHSALSKTKETYPLFNGYIIYFAQKKSGTTAVYGSRSSNAFIHSKKFADVIFFDSSGAIAKTAFVTDIPSDDRRDIINAQIHYGRFGGLPVKILYSLLGLCTGLLSITGFLIWSRRRTSGL